MGAGAWLPQRGRYKIPCGGLRLWREAQHPAQVGGARQQDYRGARQDHSGRGAGVEAGRRVPVQWPRRSRTMRLRNCSDAKILAGWCTAVWHLSWTPVDGVGGEREDGEDEVRPSRRKPSSAGYAEQARDNYQPEPWLCGGCRDIAEEYAGDACVSVRRYFARFRTDRQARVLLPRASRSESGAARRGLFVRQVY